MAEININIPGFREIGGQSPIVIIGPNGSGKTHLAIKIAQANEFSSISAQRRTWIDDNLPVLEEKQLQTNTRNTINQWRNHAWQPTEEINFVMSKLVQDHSTLITKRNEDASLHCVGDNVSVHVCWIIIIWFLASFFPTLTT